MPPTHHCHCWPLVSALLFIPSGHPCSRKVSRAFCWRRVLFSTTITWFRLLFLIAICDWQFIAVLRTSPLFFRKISWRRGIKWFVVLLFAENCCYSFMVWFSFCFFIRLSHCAVVSAEFLDVPNARMQMPPRLFTSSGQIIEAQTCCAWSLQNIVVRHYILHLTHHTSHITRHSSLFHITTDISLSHSL